MGFSGETKVVMERWVGKVAVVTGASSGIGAAVAVDLAKAGLIVVGLARRTEPIENLKRELNGASGQLHAYECDVTSEESIKTAFQWIETTFGGVNILINNAGTTHWTSILGHEDSIQHIRKVIDTNVVGLVMCTKEAFNILQRTGDIGHIVNISSVLGHVIPFVRGRFITYNMYPGTKHAVRATSEVLRQELIHLNKKVKISQVSPGYVRTGFLEAGNFPNPEGIYDSVPTLTSKDVSDSILFVIATPPHVQIHDLIIKPVGEQA